MSSSNPQPGDVLAGKYRIEQVLGVGGMGAVVAAHHEELDQKVAIKYLLPDALKNAEVVARFSREARAAAKIRGEHVARVIDVGKFPDGAPYMVMEYLEGNDLAKQLEKNGPLKFEDAVRHIIEACEALAQAHAAKIVHRDLKPANLFLAKQPGGRSIVKVLDFGISKVDDAASAGGLTKTSALMGTAYYMSPEQMMTPKGIDHRSDIWSLGVILYELLGGRVPFTGETVPEIVAGILNNEPTPLRELRPDVPAALEAVVVKCMQTKASDRYSSVAKLGAALAPFASANDRAPQSVLAMSRVLGEEEQIASTPPPSMAKTELGNAQAQTGPNAGVAPTAASAGVAPQTPGGSFVPQKTALLQTPMPSSQPGIGVTAQAMSTSAITPKKSSPMPMIAGGAALVVALGIGGFFAFGKKSPNADTPSTGGGIVATSPSTTTSSPPATASAETKAIPTSTSTALTVLEPIPSAAPSVAASAGVATRVTTTVTGKGNKPVASAATSAATTAAAAPSVTATATASAASTGSKNPLNMGIK